jgi:hypothetical protein
VACEISRQGRQAIVVAVRPAVLNRQIAALDKARFAETLVERTQPTGIELGRRTAEEADHRHTCLLSARRERPRGRAAEQRDELAALHSITSSASASRFGGISIPRVFAVFRLMISSNLVGCKTGNSAG